MTRWAFALTLIVLACGAVAVSVARCLGRSGGRVSVLLSVIATWIAAYVLWGFAGGLAARYGWIARYDGGPFGLLAVVGAVWQYRTHLARGRDRGLAVFVAGQLAWLLIVMYRNSAFGF